MASLPIAESVTPLPFRRAITPDLPRQYDFGALTDGDALAVPLNGRPHERVWTFVAQAARTYRETVDPGFDWLIWAEPGFVMLERVPQGLTSRQCQERLAARYAARGRLVDRLRRRCDTWRADRAARMAS